MLVSSGKIICPNRTVNILFGMDTTPEGYCLQLLPNKGVFYSKIDKHLGEKQSLFRSQLSKEIRCLLSNFISILNH